MRLVSFPISPAYYHQKPLCRLFSTRGWEVERFRVLPKEGGCENEVCNMSLVKSGPYNSEMSINREFTDLL